MTIKVLVVNAGEQPALQEVTRNLESFKGLLNGGYPQIIGPSRFSDYAGPQWFGYCDEDGALKGLPVNPIATVLARTLGWLSDTPLVGPVVFFGGTGPDEADFPTELIERLGL